MLGGEGARVSEFFSKNANLNKRAHGPESLT